MILIVTAHARPLRTEVDLPRTDPPIHAQIHAQFKSRDINTSHSHVKGQLSRQFPNLWYSIMLFLIAFLSSFLLDHLSFGTPLISHYLGAVLGRIYLRQFINRHVRVVLYAWLNSMLTWRKLSLHTALFVYILSVPWWPSSVDLTITSQDSPPSYI